MPAVRDPHPNMLVAAVFAALLGFIMLGLACDAKARGEEFETNAVFLGAAFLIGSVAAYDRHKILKAMSPEERDRYWARMDARWRETADMHARSVLGSDYDRK